MYGKGKEDSLSDEWDNTFSDMLDGSMDAAIKTEPYETMYDEENYSDNSNIEWNGYVIVISTLSWLK